MRAGRSPTPSSPAEEGSLDTIEDQPLLGGEACVTVTGGVAAGTRGIGPGLSAATTAAAGVLATGSKALIPRSRCLDAVLAIAR